MRRVFADTSFYIAIAFPADALRERARETYLELGDAEIHTSENVLSELLAYASRNPLRRIRALNAVRGLLESESIIVHEQSHERFVAALDLYEQRLDKGYSLVDCDSMNLMRELGVSEVLSSDKHFTQEGFTRLY